jgi:hypothetical protein
MFQRRAGRRERARECLMKLQLITASVIAYTVLAMAWICYAELALS